ncbi:MAG: hypothetical protein HY537_16615 [Deltaproteobacteria bacterium]|nr:hypothetical protein [Deltaproteobacteria bacterium]
MAIIRDTGRAAVGLIRYDINIHIIFDKSDHSITSAVQYIRLPSWYAPP